MQLTSEQINIIQTNSDIKINAVAGSGKTTTIIEYARTRPQTAKILYLAFNRSVKTQAEIKFAELNINNVKVETAHSLAYKHIVFQHNYNVRNDSFRTSEIVDILGINSTSEKLYEYILANHIGKFVSYFCNSAAQKVLDINYLDIVNDTKAKIFVKANYHIIRKQTRILLSKMDKGEIDITHDFYLKKFQLSNPQLFYDYILFDEGQDASPAMLDVFLKQKAVKVIVGDTHQQIYGWRHAVNSLQSIDYPVYQLSNSFRFSQDIATLASEILKRKAHITEHENVKISGVGKHDKVTSKAIIARTNLGLLLKAIEQLTEKKKVNKIYFEGNINSYTYAADGASLFDILNLYKGRHHLIKDKFVKSMKDLDELVDYINKTDDTQLSMMIEIVKKYDTKIPGIIKLIKEKHVPDAEKDDAEIIFSTVHRAKGMEYSAVQLANDFLTEEKLIKLAKEYKNEKLDYNKLNEEINLLYVAITRTKNYLFIPETLMPENFPKSNKIILEKTPEKKEYTVPIIYEKENNKVPFSAKNKIKKAYSLVEVRKKNQNAYLPWSQDMDDKLTELFCEGKSKKEIVAYFSRTRGAIDSRIKKLELYEKYN